MFTNTCSELHGRRREPVFSHFLHVKYFITKSLNWINGVQYTELPYPCTPSPISTRIYTLYHGVPTLLPSSTRRKGRHKSFEGSYPTPPTGIGDRFSQTISNSGHAVLFRHKRKWWTNSGDHLFNSLLWALLHSFSLHNISPLICPYTNIKPSLARRSRDVYTAYVYTTFLKLNIHLSSFRSVIGFISGAKNLHIL